MRKKMLNPKDAVSAHKAECYITVGGKRRLVMMARNFEGKAQINTKEVPRLGNVVIGHKADTLTLAFSMTIYKCTEIFDDMIEEFIRTGALPTFTIQTTNDDQASSVGRSTKIYYDCVLDGDVLLSMFDDEGDFIEQKVEGYCDSFSRPEKFTDPAYM